MLMAKIVDNKIVEFIDTDKPEDYPDFVEIPEHVPSNADVRFFHTDWTPKTETELLAEGLIEPEPEPELEPEEHEPSAEEQARWKRDGLLYELDAIDRKSTRLNSSHVAISYAVFCLKKKK